MIINNNVSSILKAYGDNKPIKNVMKEKIAPDSAGGQDEIILSAEAQSFSHLLQKAKNSTGVRQEKINDLTQRIDAGQYKVDARIVAEKMLSARY